MSTRALTAERAHGVARPLAPERPNRHALGCHASSTAALSAPTTRTDLQHRIVAGWALDSSTTFESTRLADDMGSGAPIGALLLTVVEAIAEVAILASVGYFLARRGILDSKARKFVNRINVSIFTPALLFSKVRPSGRATLTPQVAFSLTPDKLGELYIVPLGFAFLTVFSAATAWLLGKLFRIPRRSQRMFAIACASFPNSNSLPVRSAQLDCG